MRELAGVRERRPTGEGEGVFSSDSVAYAAVEGAYRRFGVLREELLQGETGQKCRFLANLAAI